MTTLESESAVAMRVQVTDEAVFVELQDGRTVTAPLSWYPRLRHGTPAERGVWELIGRGSGIHWPELDEDISIASMLSGRPSAERQESLQRWLEKRRVPSHGLPT